MMRLKTIVASVALVAAMPAMAAYHTTPAPVGPCKSNQLIKRVDRNQSNFFAQCGWEKRIKMSGSINTVFGMANDVWGYDSAGANDISNDFNHSLTFNSNMESTSNRNVDSANDLWLHRAVLNVDAVLNDWAEAHVSLLYWNDGSIMNNVDAQMYNRYHGSWQEGNNGNNLPVDEANVVIGNFAHSPIYLRVGRQYGDFGSFNKNSEVASMTQLFSQGLHDAVQVGFVDVSGFSGSVSAFRSVDRGSIWDASGLNSEDRPEEGVNNFIVSLDYVYDNGTISYDAKVDYMRDLFGADFFDGYNGNGVLGKMGGYQDPKDNNGMIRPGSNTSAWAFTVNGKYGDFDAVGQWVGATQDLDADIWSSGGVSTSNIGDGDVNGARPTAWMVELGYSFPLMGRDSRLSVNYQKTHDAMIGSQNAGEDATTNYYIPERRYVVKFDHNVSKSVDLGVAYYRDKDYSSGHFQSAHNTNAASDNSGDEFRNLSGTGNANGMLVLNLSAKFN